MAKFKPGQSGNPNGRPKGSPNKLTQSQRAALGDAMAGHLDSIPALIDSLDSPREKLDAIVKFLPYILPKLQSVEVSGIEQQEIKLPKFTWDDSTI